MMRELIDRFAYRFQLWLREQRGDFRCSDGSSPPIKIYSKSESVPQMFVHHAGVYFGLLIILGCLARLVLSYLPSARFAVVSIVFILLCCLTPIAISTFLGEWKVKKQALDGTKSSNQSLEPTAGRRTERLEDEL
jgi:hypothetical protein